MKKLGGDIWELRPLSDRVLFAAWTGSRHLHRRHRRCNHNHHNHRRRNHNHHNRRRRYPHHRECCHRAPRQKRNHQVRCHPAGYRYRIQHLTNSSRHRAPCPREQ
ncbi:MAG: hypothetical protein II574_10495 [Ruminococcus sp.]|nr:hypothetical protein [Ruminococcus sp.]